MRCDLCVRRLAAAAAGGDDVDGDEDEDGGAGQWSVAGSCSSPPRR